MKQTAFVSLASLALLCAGACSKKNVVAQVPPPQPPAATTPARPAPAPVKQAARPQPPAAAKQATVAVNRPRPAQMPAAQKAALNDLLAKLTDALFDYDQSTIRSDASEALKTDVGVIRNILSDYPSQKLLIEGHADERGSAEYNLALGDRRAHSVEQFLASMSIPQSQLTVISYGKEKPVCTDENEQCWQRNRRAHVTAP